nr:MAG TPA: hypothetical protein [Caudoviricetes sp.]
MGLYHCFFVGGCGLCATTLSTPTPPPPPPVPYGGLNNPALKHNAPLNNRRFNNGTLISSLQFLNAFLYISLKKRYINIHQK